MKPITGSVLSSKAVSVKKSASILSRFVASETGAHQDVAGFLKRTSQAADELVQFYGCLLAAKEDSGAGIFEEAGEKKIEEEEEARREEGGKKSKKKQKKKKRKERKEEADAEADRDLEHGEIEDDARSIRVYDNGGAADVVDLKSEKTSRKKKRRSGDETEGLGGKTVESAGNESNADEKSSKRKKKKRKEKGDAIELVAEGGEEHPPAKKRKLRREP